MPKNQDSKTLFNAAQKGNIEDIKRLIENGADVNAKDGDGNTPSQVAKTDEIKQLLINAMK